MDQGSEDHINARAGKSGPAVPPSFEVASAFTKGLGGLLPRGFRSVCGTYSRYLRRGTPSPRETVASAFCSIHGSCDVIRLSTSNSITPFERRMDLRIVDVSVRRPKAKCNATRTSMRPDLLHQLFN